MSTEVRDRLAEEFVFKEICYGGLEHLMNSATAIDCLKAFEGGWNSAIQNDERVKALVTALEHIKNGCLVPPDGGQPDIYDYIKTATEALKQWKGTGK